MEISTTDLFSNGRTCYNFSKQQIPQTLLEEIYNLVKLGPTSANCSPLRMMFVESEEGREKLLECVMDGNIDAVKTSPVTVIFAYDTKFYEKMDVLFPHNPKMKDFLSTNEKAAFDTAFRNSSLQAAYFMIVARSKGLAVGPMSGFDTAKLEEVFFSGTTWKANFICNLGYAEGSSKYERLPRLKFDEACQIV